MGRMGAIGMAEEVKAGHLSMINALHWHLTSNHYPPIPTSMVKVALRAIRYAKKEQWHKRVRLPQDVTWRGLRMAPVGNIIQDLHLEEFLNG